MHPDPSSTSDCFEFLEGKDEKEGEVHSRLHDVGISLLHVHIRYCRRHQRLCNDTPVENSIRRRLIYRLLSFDRVFGYLGLVSTIQSSSVLYLERQTRVGRSA